ncbi:MAG: hypothetical protein ACREQ2_06130 [Candidatus Binatia bacterium]
MRIRWYLFISAAFVFALSGAAAAACWDDGLDSKNGDLLVMRSGAVYRVLNAPATAFWLPLARFTICNQVVNVDGEMLTYYEVRNQDANQLVMAGRER